MAHGLTIHFCL